VEEWRIKGAGVVKVRFIRLVVFKGFVRWGGRGGSRSICGSRISLFLCPEYAEGRDEVCGPFDFCSLR
jgi:hypothetical protein